MNTYEKVENLYKNNQESFILFEREFLNSFDIPTYIFRDTIKRLLVEAVNKNGKKSFMLNYTYTIKDMFLYYIVMFYFFLLSFFIKKQNKQKKYDVVFECELYYDFESNYKKLYEKIKHLKVAIFSKIGHLDKYNLFVFNKKNQIIYDYEISNIILKTQINKFFIYKKLSVKSNINFINLSLRMMRYIALYESDSKDVFTKCFISAADIYYNSLRYYIYKKNGMENIMLIQSGMKQGKNSTWSVDLYVHCDYYFGYSKYFIDSLCGNIANKLPIGSVRLYQETCDLIPSEVFDIMFVEQMAFVEMEHGHKMSSYLKIVNMLIEFALKHKQYKIVYRIRPLKLSVYFDDKEKMNIINDLYNRLKNANIIIDDYSENSYHVLSKSKVIVYYTSTLGFEALGLDKKTLCCNIDKNENLPFNDEIGVLVEDNYTVFEKKLLYLLNSKNENIKKYYKEQKLIFQNLDGNPIDKIANIITKLVD